MDLLEHADAFARIDEGHLLGRADDHGAIDQHKLAKAEGDVAGPGRHIDDEHIKGVEARRLGVGIWCHARAPVDVKEKLLHGLHHHEPAPYHGRVCVGPCCGRREKEAHRHAWDRVVRHGDQGALCVSAPRRTLGELRLAEIFKLHELGDARSKHVEVQEADARAAAQRVLGRGREAQREVDGHRTLANPAFSTRHGDDLLHVGNPPPGLRAAAPWHRRWDAFVVAREALPLAAPTYQGILVSAPHGRAEPANEAWAHGGGGQMRPISASGLSSMPNSCYPLSTYA